MRSTLFGVVALVVFISIVAVRPVDAGDVSLYDRYPLTTAPYLGTNAPVIDGVIGLTEWADAAEIGPFKSGLSGTFDGTERRAWICWNDESVYVAFRFTRDIAAPLPDEPSATDDAALWAHGNFAEVCFDVQHAEGQSRRNFYAIRMYGAQKVATAKVGVKATIQTELLGGWELDPTGGGLDFSWAPAVQYKVTVDSHTGIWEGELAIPKSALGSLASGSMCGFDIRDNWTTPYTYVSDWSYRGYAQGSYQWLKIVSFSHLRFGSTDGSEPIVRFQQADHAGALLPVVRFDAIGKAATSPHVKVELYKNNDAGGGFKGVSYYTFLEDPAQGDEGYIGKSLSELIQAMFVGDPEAEKAPQYDAGSSDLVREIDVPAAKRRGFGVFGASGSGDTWLDPIGDYLARYTVTSDAGTVVAAGVSTFRVDPFPVSVAPHWLYAKVVDVTADISQLALSTSSEYEAEFSVRDAADETLRATKTVTVTPGGNNQIEVTFDVDKNGAGATHEWGMGKQFAFDVKLSNVDNASTPIVVAETRVVKGRAAANPDWFDNTVGLGVIDGKPGGYVPPPWTPVTYNSSQRTVSVWGRTYHFDKLFPTQITTQSATLLPAVAGVQLKLVMPGATAPESLAWDLTKYSLGSASPRKVVYNVTLTSSRITLEGQMSVEFDGQIWYDLTARPTSGDDLALQHLYLEIPLVPERAKLKSVHGKYLVDQGISQLPTDGAVPASWRSGSLVAAATAFTPYVWIGDEKGGIGWACEGPERWNVHDKTALIETLPSSGGQPAFIRVNIIKALAPDTGKLPAPTDALKAFPLSFGLHATPLRERPSEQLAHMWQISGNMIDNPDPAKVDDAERYYRAEASDTRILILHAGWRAETKEANHAGWPTRPVGSTVEQAFKETVKLARDDTGTEMGQNSIQPPGAPFPDGRYDGIVKNVVLYTGWGVDTEVDEWKFHQHEFGRKTSNGGFQSASFGAMKETAGIVPQFGDSAYADYMAWTFADLIKTYGVQGAFWDSTSNLDPDFNLRVGHGWKDEAGNVHPTYAIRGMRSAFMRLYSIFHGEPIDGVANPVHGAIVNHPGSIWPINVFSDVHHRGEGAVEEAAYLFHDPLPNDQFGAPAWPSLEFFRANYAAEPFGQVYSFTPKSGANALQANNHLALMLPHGLPTAKGNSMFNARNWRVDGLETYGFTGEADREIWAARDWLPLDKSTQWLTYYHTPWLAAIGPGGDSWEKSVIKSGSREVVDVGEWSPAPNSLLSSTFVSADRTRAVVVVSNLNSLPGTHFLEDDNSTDEKWTNYRQKVVDSHKLIAQVRIDPTDLGMSPRGLLRLDDAIHPAEDTGVAAPLPITPDGTFDLSLRSQRYRLLKLGLTVPSDALALWVNGDTGFIHMAPTLTVAKWQDQSAAANHLVGADSDATQNPALVYGGINGHGAVRFNGSSTHLDIPDSSTVNNASFDEKTVVVVIKTGADVTSRQVIWEQGGVDRGLNLYIDGGSVYGHVFNNSGSVSWGGAHISAPVQANRVYIVELAFEFDGNAGAVRGYLNGEAFGVASAGGVLESHPGASGLGRASDGTRFHDGAFPGTGHYFGGDVAELLSYNKALSVDERGYVNAYVGGRYGLDRLGIPGGAMALWVDATKKGDVLLDANGRVRTWSDKSVNGIHLQASVEQYRPTYRSGTFSSPASVVFQRGGDGDDFFSVGDSGHNALDKAGPYVAKSVAAVFRTGADVNARQVIYEQGSATGLNIYVHGGKMYAGIFTDGVWSSFASGAVQPNQMYCVILVADLSGDLIRTYLNGVAIGHDSSTSIQPLPSHASGGIGVGRGRSAARFHDGLADYSTGGGDAFGGQLSELVLYNSVLSGAEQSALGRYFAGKYGITGLERQRHEAVIWLDAGTGLTQAGGNASEVAGWADQSGRSNHHSATSNYPLLVNNGINGLPALNFANSYGLQHPDSSDINNGTFSSKTMVVAFRTGSNVSTRQTIWEQGNINRGLNIHIDGGKVYLNAWSMNSTPSWGPTHVSATVQPNTNYVAELVFRGSSDGGYLQGFLNASDMGRATGVGSALGPHHYSGGAGATRWGTRFYDGSTTPSGEASGQPFNGLIAEIVQSNTMDDLQRIDVANELRRRYLKN